MKLQFALLFSLLFTITNARAQVSPTILVGKWQQVEVNGATDIKCPYQLEFKNDKGYVVYDCREPKDSGAIAEYGIWSVNGQILSLNRRIFFGDTYFQPKGRSLNCSVKTAKATKLVIVYRTPKGEITEEYKKVN